MYNKRKSNNDTMIDLILILSSNKRICRIKNIFIHLPTFSIVSPSSSSYSCMVSWQVILLLLHNFTISLSFVSVLMPMLKGNFDSSCVFVLPGFLYGTTSSASSGFGERTSWHSLRSTVFEDIGFVEIFIVSSLFILSFRFTCIFYHFFISFSPDNSLIHSFLSTYSLIIN